MSNAWQNLSPEERDKIQLDRSKASYRTPFNGKNPRQRRMLH